MTKELYESKFVFKICKQKLICYGERLDRSNMAITNGMVGRADTIVHGYF